MNVELLKSRATVSSEEARRGGKASDWLFLGLIVLVLMVILGGSLAITFLILQFVAHNLSSVLGV
jgi:hypothetical protein